MLSSGVAWKSGSGKARNPGDGQSPEPVTLRWSLKGSGHELGRYLLRAKPGTRATGGSLDSRAMPVRGGSRTRAEPGNSLVYHKYWIAIMGRDARFYRYTDILWYGPEMIRTDTLRGRIGFLSVFSSKHTVSFLTINLKLMRVVLLSCIFYY